jgi:catechol 2,3-dioxygenase-like lactoylglutathione lyase family enzyme
MARIRHIALVVKDLDATADFYQKAFGLSRSEKSEGKTAWRIYMSDGEVNLALLQYKSEVGSGLKDPNAFVGIHHFGFQCEDLPEQQKRIEAAGGKFFYDLGDPDDDDFERKFKDPNGIIFDINWKGWSLTAGKLSKKQQPVKKTASKKPARQAAAAARKRTAKKSSKMKSSKVKSGKARRR